MGYAAVSFGLFIFIFAYFTLNAPQNPPRSQQTTSAAAAVNFCELADPAGAPTFQAPADYATKTGSPDAPPGSREVTSDCDDTHVRHVFGPSLTTYQLIRKNVPLSTTDVKEKKENFTGNSCHFDSAQEINIETPGVDTTKFKVFFPEISGEISLDREIPSRTRGRDSNLLYFIDYGLVFLLHLNPDGTFTEYKGDTTQGDSDTFILADVYRDIGSARPELPPDAFECDSATTAGITPKQQVFVPNQSPSTTQDQLQLQYFVFNNGSVVNGWGIHCKPAVYLYPPKKQLVNVKVHPSGFLTYVDPPYDQSKGWLVEANPNGALFTINHKPLTNNYLYFESKIRDEVIQKPTQGWVVKFDELENLYKDILPKLGLNQAQVNDFSEYWNKALPNSPYYFVGIIDQDNVNEIERLEITPKPDSINRVRVYFERLDSYKEVIAPKLYAKPYTLNPDSFAVTEWGGMVKNDPNHPFTCSQ